MGFLHESEPLPWPEALGALRFVRDHGIEQFLSIFQRCRYLEADPFKWGDEIEHGVFRLVGTSPEDQSRSVRVALRSPELIAQLMAVEADAERATRACVASGAGGGGPQESCFWMPEYGSWMLESTPARPFEGLEGVAHVEASMRLRRKRLAAALKPGEVAPTVTSMPLFGTGDFCEPSSARNSSVAASLFVPDEAIFPHARFPTLTQNIRLRRGNRVEIRRPKLGGAAPPPNGVAPIPATVEEADALDHVYADAMAFGMGCCCLQVTMQAADMAQSRHLYDQLAPLTPVLLALTAATPFLRGWICDDDTRWGQLAQSVDDRTRAERVAPGTLSEEVGAADDRLAGKGLGALPKSRYDSIDCYIGEDPRVAGYNDVALVADKEYVQRLMTGGVDETLARHVAHLFARDPLVVFADRLQLDDTRDVDHWENLQSTNWQTLRWKPPLPEKAALDSTSEGHVGWRVEFRSMELQLTDFENAAFASFIVLLSRAILALKLDLYIPMSKLEENMLVAQRREACTAQRFWFRTDIQPADPSLQTQGSEEPYRLMTISEILMGSRSSPGLIPLCRRFLDEAGCAPETRATLEGYLAFIARRAKGSVLTTASWMRRFVVQHESYRQDGRVPPAAAFDLMVAAAEIGEGRRPCQELLGDVTVPPLMAGAPPAPPQGGTGAASHLPVCCCCRVAVTEASLNTPCPLHQSKCATAC